jgi:hypothetical protein
VGEPWWLATLLEGRRRWNEVVGGVDSPAGEARVVLAGLGEQGKGQIW